MSESRKRRLRDRSSGPATLISEGCKLTGAITGNGDYIISGEVDGDCDIDGTVTVTGNGFWRGLIKADAIIVAGAIEGEIEARNRIEIGNTARISGTVIGEAIAVAEGAVVEGQMRTTGRAEPVEFVEKRKESDSVESS